MNGSRVSLVTDNIHDYFETTQQAPPSHSKPRGEPGGQMADSKTNNPDAERQG
jgi:hypothetical protein